MLSCVDLLRLPVMSGSFAEPGFVEKGETYVITCFIQSLVENGHLVLVWIPGKLCVSDLLTKILNRDLTEFHRAQIGILEVTAPEVWKVMTGKELKKNKVTTKKSEQVLDDADVQHDHEPAEVLNEENPLSIFSSTEAVWSAA